MHGEAFLLTGHLFNDPLYVGTVKILKHIIQTWYLFKNRKYVLRMNIMRFYAFTNDIINDMTICKSYSIVLSKMTAISNRSHHAISQ